MLQTNRNPTRRRLIKILAAGVAAPAVLRVTGALAAYPDRPVRIVVANTPGGPSDIIARIMAATLQEATGATFFVENRGGGGGNIGMGAVARSEPDGYTVLLATSSYSVNPSLFETLPYDPFKDFVAVAELATSPNVFTVKPELGAGTMKEFVALAKQEPDKFNVSTPPIGTTPQLQAEVLKVARGPGTDGDRHAYGWRRSAESPAQQHGPAELRRARPRPPAHQERRHQGSRGHRRGTLVRFAGRPHHGWRQATRTLYSRPTRRSWRRRKRRPRPWPGWKGSASRCCNARSCATNWPRSGFEVQAKDGKTHMARVAKEVPMYGEIIASAGIAKR